MIDWAAAKAEFILRPEMTYAQLAEKYHCHPVTIREVAAREHWKQQRRNQVHNYYN